MYFETGLWDWFEWIEYGIQTQKPSHINVARQRQNKGIYYPNYYMIYLMLILYYHWYIIGIKLYDFPPFLIIAREAGSCWQRLALMFPCMLNKALHRGILSTYLSQAIRLLYLENIRSLNAVYMASSLSIAHYFNA